MNDDKDRIGQILTDLPIIPSRPDFGHDIAKTEVGENPETDQKRPPEKKADDP